MKDKDVISKGPKRRDPTCFQNQHAILIPAGTTFRQDPGKEGVFTCPVAHGTFTVTRADAEAHPDTFKRVVA
jgi:hypothetical protein